VSICPPVLRPNGLTYTSRANMCWASAPRWVETELSIALLSSTRLPFWTASLQFLCTTLNKSERPTFMILFGLSKAHWLTLCTPTPVLQRNIALLAWLWAERTTFMTLRGPAKWHWPTLTGHHPYCTGFKPSDTRPFLWSFNIGQGYPPRFPHVPKNG